MSKKGSPSEKCCTTGSGHQRVTSTSVIEEKSRSVLNSGSLKSSEKFIDDSRLNDSGVWSGSNIQSEEIITPDSPVSKSSEFNFSSDKMPSDKGYLRLDSGIDVSVSQNFSELSLENIDEDKSFFNDLNNPSRSKTSSTTNINEQFTTNSLKKDHKSRIPSVQLSLLDTYFQQNEDGDTELHLAIIHKFIEAVYALVRMVPDPSYLNIKNDDRQTPLHLAVMTGEHRLVRLLVCAGASLDLLDNAGNTALHLAIQADDLDCTRAILNPITVPETTAAQLQYAPYQSHSLKDVANTVNYEGQTCVHLAALNRNIEMLRHLIWSGADISAKEWKGGQTCLHMAVEQRNLELCVFLLESGIDAEEPSYAGRTAYQTARYDCWDLTVAKALREHGADTCDEDSDDDDDDMIDVPESSFNNGFPIHGNGLVNVGA